MKLKIPASHEAVRREFLENVSHELRTPIAAIKGFAETLLEGALDDPVKRVEFVRVISRHASRLEFLVEELLSASEKRPARKPIKRKAARARR